MCSNPIGILALAQMLFGHQDVLQPLEMGIHVLIVPRIRDISYLQSVVDYVKFPPIGKCGIPVSDAEDAAKLMEKGVRKKG